MTRRNETLTVSGMSSPIEGIDNEQWRETVGEQAAELALEEGAMDAELEDEEDGGELEIGHAHGEDLLDDNAEDLDFGP